MHSQYIFTFLSIYQILCYIYIVLISCIKLIIINQKKFFKHLEIYTYRKLKTKN